LPKLFANNFLALICTFCLVKLVYFDSWAAFYQNTSLKYRKKYR